MSWIKLSKIKFKFCNRYVDGRLVLSKVEDIENIMEQFNSFDECIEFTIHRFEDDIVHFLHIKTNGCETDLYYRATHTGQYCDLPVKSFES